MFKKSRAMKKKGKFDKFEECDDGKITTDDYVDFMCGLAFYELIAIIIGIILIVVLP